MKNAGSLALAGFAIALFACASAPRDEAPGPDAVFEDVTAKEVRQAAVEVLSDVSQFMEPARVTEDGTVIAELAIADWTTYEVSFEELPSGVAMTVEVAQDPASCSTTRNRSPRPRTQIYYGDAVIGREDGGYEVVRAPVATGDPVRWDCGYSTRTARRALWVVDEIRETLDARAVAADLPN